MARTMKNIKNKDLRVWIYISLGFVALLVASVVVMNLQSNELINWLNNSNNKPMEPVPTSVLPTYILISLTLITFIWWLLMGLIVLIKGIISKVGERNM